LKALGTHVQAMPVRKGRDEAPAVKKKAVRKRNPGRRPKGQAKRRGH